MRKEDIIDAAFDEFGQYNYDRASVNSIIEKSKTSKGTYYHYFKSKESLYFELINKVLEEKIRFLKEENVELSSNASLFDIFRCNIGSAMHFAIEYPKYAKFLEKVAIETNIEIKNKTQEIIGKSTNEYLRSLINNNVRQKIIRDDLPKELIYDFMTYYFTKFNDFISSAHIEIKVENAEKIDEYLNYYIDILENGIKA